MRFYHVWFPLVLCLSWYVSPVFGIDQEAYNETITRPLIAARKAQVETYKETVRTNISPGGAWVSGDAGEYAVGNDDVMEPWEYDYVWLTARPVLTRGLLPEMPEIDPDSTPVLMPVSPHQTYSCNKADMPRTHMHTYGALHTPLSYKCGWPRYLDNIYPFELVPGVVISPATNTPFPLIDPEMIVRLNSYVPPDTCCAIPCGPFCCKTVCCVDTFEYKPLNNAQLGFPAGFCIDVKFPPSSDKWCCGTTVTVAHLIDYYFPTTKVNLSRQPMASRYLDEEDVEDYFEEFAESLVDEYEERSRDVYTEVADARGKQIDISGHSIHEIGSIAGGGHHVTHEGNGYEYNWSRGFDKGYLRVFNEDLVMRDRFTAPFYPHLWPNTPLIGQFEYATDRKEVPISPTGAIPGLEWGYQLGYWLDYSKNHDRVKYQQHLRNPESCARQNSLTQKTPVDYLTKVNEEWGVSPIPPTPAGEVRDFRLIQCLQNIGEVFPLSANTRPHNSDYFFQTLVKGMAQYHTAYLPPQRFTFDFEKDRFHIYNTMGDAEFRDDIPGPKELGNKFYADKESEYQCDLFGELDPKQNVEYQELNRNTPEVVGGQGETTSTVFTKFSGCYGFPGRTNWNFDLNWGGASSPTVWRGLESDFGDLDTFGYHGDLRLQ